jgi:adenine-specific DNA-methyltransferase
MDLLSKVNETLRKDKRLTTEDGVLLKSKIMELALKLDKDLLRLLVNENELKENFFVSVNEIIFFNQDKFIKFVDNKEFLPDSFTTFKNKIGLTVNDRYFEENKEVVLSWPFKDCILEAGMDEKDEKRDEVFFNEILAPDQIDRLKEPKVLTSFRRIDENDEHKVTEIKSNENFIIKGNNLLALYSLKKSFLGRIKLIYIDPPYGNDADVFYKDNFKQSTWLTFMKNRLEAAKELLSYDGALFVQISDANEAKIRLLLDEIFGQDNFINRITVKTKSPSGFQTVNLGVFEVAEYILLYGKSKKDWKYNPQFVPSNYDDNYSSIVINKSAPNEEWRIEDLFEYVSHKLGFSSYKEGISKTGEASLFAKVADYALRNAECVFRFTEIGNDAGKESKAKKEKSKKNPGTVFSVKRVDHYDIYVLNGREMTFYKKKVREIDGRLTPTTQLTNIWTDISWEGIASEGGVKLKGGKKPEKLLRRIIDMGTLPGDIVLDFFVGSGTTCAFAHKMGRQYIGVEQLDYGKNGSVIRLKNVISGEQTGISKIVNWQGGGDFIYCELKEWNEKYVNKIAKANSSKELLETWNFMVNKGFLSYKVNVAAFGKNVHDFENLSLENQKRFLFEVLDKNHLYVNLYEIDDKDYGVSREDKELNREFYGGL